MLLCNVIVVVCRSLRSLGYVFFFKQKTAYEMRISDWSSDVCSSDLQMAAGGVAGDDDAARRDAVVGGVAVEPGERPAHLVDHGADAGSGCQAIVEAGEGEAGFDEGGRQIAVVALVEALPIADVDEGQQGRAGAGREENERAEQRRVGNEGGRKG